MDPALMLKTEETLASLGVTARTLAAAQRQAIDERGYLVLPGVVAPPTEQPTFVAVPAKATIPTAVPAGGGYYGPRKQVPVGALILVFVGLVGAVAAATRKRVLREE